MRLQLLQIQAFLEKVRSINLAHQCCKCWMLTVMEKPTEQNSPASPALRSARASRRSHPSRGEGEGRSVSEASPGERMHALGIWPIPASFMGLPVLPHLLQCILLTGQGECVSMPPILCFDRQGSIQAGLARLVISLSCYGMRCN